MTPSEIPSPSGESRVTTVSPGVDPCEEMAKPAAGDASDSQHRLIATTSVQLVNPATGELVELDGPTEQLAEFLADMREHESLCREAKKLVTREVVSRMDKGATWTLHVAGLKLSAASPQPTEEFDGPELREALIDLVDQGVLSIEAVDAAVETVVTYRPRKAGITALRKLGGRVASVISEHCREVEKDRYVSVNRA